MEELFFRIYKQEVKRGHKRTDVFIRWVIHAAITNGFNGEVISLDSEGLRLAGGVSADSARRSLKVLHNNSLIIYLGGYGQGYEKERSSIPLGFMLYPQQEEKILKEVEKLKTGKLTILDFKRV
jgi:hypothetical protein